MSMVTTSTEGLYVRPRLGAMLRTLRIKKGLSLRQIAERSGIGRSTLSRWERGMTPLDSDVLEPLFCAMSLASEDRKALGPMLSSPKKPDPQAAGRRRLLRAVRLRNNLSLSQAGAKVGVTKATLSRWENGERSPGRLRLSEAARCVGATETEVLAIAHPGPLGEGSIPGLDCLHDRVHRLRGAIPSGSSPTLDLDFLGLDAAIAQEPGPESRRLRLELRAAYVEWLGWWYRDAEAGRAAARLLPALRKEPDFGVWGRVLRACANYASEFRSDPGAAIDLLLGACKTLGGGPSEGFVRRELSGLYLSVGEWESAKEQLDRAEEAGSGEEDPAVHAYCCSMIGAELWSVAGRHEEALIRLPSGGVPDRYLSSSSALGRSRILLRAGDATGARRTLDSAIEHASQQGLTHFEVALRKSLRELA